MEKLLVCISGGKAKKDVQYLRLPGNCIEAIGALRRYGVDGWACEGGTQLVPLTPFACLMAGHQPRLDRFLTESARGRLKIAKRDTGYGLSHEDEQTASSLESVYDGAILLVLVLSLFLPAVPATMTPCVSCL